MSYLDPYGDVGRRRSLHPDVELECDYCGGDWDERHVTKGCPWRNLGMSRHEAQLQQAHERVFNDHVDKKRNEIEGFLKRNLSFEESDAGWRTRKVKPKRQMNIFSHFGLKIISAFTNMFTRGGKRA